MCVSIVILGGGVAGLTAAFALKWELGDQADVVLISRQEQFVFFPALIWLMLGWRTILEITFNLKSALEAKNIRYICAQTNYVDPNCSVVITEQGTFKYDYLIIATRPKFDWDSIPGLGPYHGYIHSICSLTNALEAQRAFQDFLKNPGPVVIGVTQGGSCFGMEYETVLNIDQALHDAGVRDKAHVTFLTSEPLIGQIDIKRAGQGEAVLERFFKCRNIEIITKAFLEHANPNELILKNGWHIPFKYSIVFPPMRGTKLTTHSHNLENEKGLA